MLSYDPLWLLFGCQSCTVYATPLNSCLQFASLHEGGELTGTELLTSVPQLSIVRFVKYATILGMLIFGFHLLFQESTLSLLWLNIAARENGNCQTIRWCLTRGLHTTSSFCLKC